MGSFGSLSAIEGSRYGDDDGRKGVHIEDRGVVKGEWSMDEVCMNLEDIQSLALTVHTYPMRGVVPP